MFSCECRIFFIKKWLTHWEGFPPLPVRFVWFYFPQFLVRLYDGSKNLLQIANKIHHTQGILDSKGIELCHDNREKKTNIVPHHASLHKYEHELQICTPLKFKMEPENQPLEKKISVGNHHFFCSILICGCVCVNM